MISVGVAVPLWSRGVSRFPGPDIASVEGLAGYSPAQAAAFPPPWPPLP